MYWNAHTSHEGRGLGPSPAGRHRLVCQSPKAAGKDEGRRPTAGMSQTGADAFTPSLKEESWKVSQPLNLPIFPPLRLRPSSLSHSEGLCPWSRGSALHSGMTVMSGAHPARPSNGQFCSGHTGDAYLRAFSAPGSLGGDSRRFNYRAAHLGLQMTQLLM